MKRNMIIFALASLLLLTGCYSLALPVDAESTIEGTGSWRAGHFTDTGNAYISLPAQGVFSNSIERAAYATCDIIVTDAQNAVSFDVSPFGSIKDPRSGMASYVLKDAQTGEKLASGLGEISNSVFRFYNGYAKTLIDAFIEESDVIISLDGVGCVYAFPVSPVGFINAVRQYLLK